jgi:hypothetical protein
LAGAPVRRAGWNAEAEATTAAARNARVNMATDLDEGIAGLPKLILVTFQVK